MDFLDQADLKYARIVVRINLVFFKEKRLDREGE
jgi:hypothetical protein